MHQKDGECKLDFTAITRDMTSVQCFRGRGALSETAGGTGGESGEESGDSEEEPPGPEGFETNALMLCRNR